MGQDHQGKDFHSGLLKNLDQDYFETQEDSLKGPAVKVRRFHASNAICSPAVYREGTRKAAEVVECLWNSLNHWQKR